MKRLLLLLPLFLLACGIMAIPANSDVLPTAEVQETKTAQEAPGTISGDILTRTTATPSCTVLAEKLNLRQFPGTDAPADPDGLKRGDSLQRIGAVAGWIKVAVADGRSGWVRSVYVECER